MAWNYIRYIKQRCWKRDGCWIHDSHVPIQRVRRKIVAAQLKLPGPMRSRFELVEGPVIATCAEPRCCNPDHLHYIRRRSK